MTSKPPLRNSTIKLAFLDLSFQVTIIEKPKQSNDKLTGSYSLIASFWNGISKNLKSYLFYPSICWSPHLVLQFDVSSPDLNSIPLRLTDGVNLLLVHFHFCRAASRLISTVRRISFWQFPNRLTLLFIFCHNATCAIFFLIYKIWKTLIDYFPWPAGGWKMAKAKPGIKGNSVFLVWLAFILFPSLHLLT